MKRLWNKFLCKIGVHDWEYSQYWIGGHCDNVSTVRCCNRCHKIEQL